MTLAKIILNKYEANSSDWKYYGDPDRQGKRSISVQGELYDLIGRQELLEEVKRLEKEQSICFRAKWYSYGSELEKITYRLQDMWYFYKLDGRRPKVECIRELRVELEQRLEKKTLRKWIYDSIRDLLRQLDEGMIPKEYCPDNAKSELRRSPQKFLEDKNVLNQKQWYLDALFALNDLEEPVYRRVFCRKVLGDSKRFEKNGQKIQRLILSAARRFHPDVDSDEEVMSASEVLSQLNIETYDQELLIKGPLKLKLCGKVVDFSLLPYGAVLNSDTMKYAEIPEDQSIKRILSIENKANFMAASYEEGTLYIFTHGFFSPRERVFLQRLHYVLQDFGHSAEPLDGKEACGSAIEYLHSGDLDYGGIRIYQNIQQKIFPELRPFMMDAAAFRKYAPELVPQEKSYLQKLEKLCVPPELEELKNCILQAGGTIEQESMLY